MKQKRSFDCAQDDGEWGVAGVECQATNIHILDYEVFLIAMVGGGNGLYYVYILTN